MRYEILKDFPDLNLLILSLSLRNSLINLSRLSIELSLNDILDLLSNILRSLLILLPLFLLLVLIFLLFLLLPFLLASCVNLVLSSLEHWQVNFRFEELRLVFIFGSLLTFLHLSQLLQVFPLFLFLLFLFIFFETLLFFEGLFLFFCELFSFICFLFLFSLFLLLFSYESFWLNIKGESSILGLINSLSKILLSHIL